MPKRNVEFFVLDMLISIERINRYSKPLKDLDDFVSDEVAFNLILRDLAIIGEAMNHVLAEKKLHAFINPGWRNIVDFRNIVIHEYFGLSFCEVFEIVKKEIPGLEREILGLIDEIKDKNILALAFSDLRDELEQMRRGESLRYLKKLEKRLKIKKN